jgi:hypothetical protein
MDTESIGAMRKKIAELERNLSTVSCLQFSYIQAILALLDAKGITDGEEFKACLEEQKKILADRFRDVEFLSTMGENFPGPREPGEK